MTQPHSPSFDFLWTHLIWDFVGDVKDLFAIRKTMRATRYVKGKHFTKEFPIGPYSYDQFLNVIKMPTIVYVNTISPKKLSISSDQRQENACLFAKIKIELPVSTTYHLGFGNQEFHSHTSNIDVSYEHQTAIVTATKLPITPDILHMSLNYTKEYQEEPFKDLGEFLVFHSNVVLDIKPIDQHVWRESVMVTVNAAKLYEDNFNLILNGNNCCMDVYTNATTLTVNLFSRALCLNMTCHNVKELTLFTTSCDEPMQVMPGFYPNLEYVHFIQCCVHPRWNIKALKPHIRFSQTNRKCLMKKSL